MFGGLCAGCVIVCRCVYGNERLLCKQRNCRDSRARALYRLACDDDRTAGAWLLGLLLLPVESFGGAAGFDSVPGAARRERKRGAGAAGFIASVGTMAYALGKFISGSLADMFGGRLNFLGGMTGSILFTVLFVLGRRVSNLHAGVGGQPAVSVDGLGGTGEGHVAVVLVLDLWHGDGGAESELSVWRRGVPMGDGTAAGDGLWMARGVSGGVRARWRHCCWRIFCCCASRRRERGLPAPEANPLNVYAADGANHDENYAGLSAILRPLLTSFPFWMVCLLSLGTTLLRETFNFWTPTYFVQYVGAEPQRGGGAECAVSAVWRHQRVGRGRAERPAWPEWTQHCAGGRHGAEHGVPAAAGAHAGTREPVDAGDSGDAGGLSAAGSVLVSGGRDEPGLWRQTWKRDGCGHYRWRGVSCGMALRRYGGARDGGLGWKNAFLALAVAAFLTAIVAMVLVAHQQMHKPKTAEA